MSQAIIRCCGPGMQEENIKIGSDPLIVIPSNLLKEFMLPVAITLFCAKLKILTPEINWIVKKKEGWRGSYAKEYSRI